MGIGKTLSTILAEKSTNVNELAERMNVAPTTIYSMIKRDSSKADITFLARMCRELGVSMERFYEDYVIEKGQKEFPITVKEQTHIKKYRTLDEYGKKAVDDLLNTEYERCEDYNKDNVINIQAAYSQVSAGTGEWLESSDFDVISVKATPEAYKADIAIPVNGDSMLPLYSSGDYVLVRRQPDIDIGEIGIFILDNNAYIKKRGEHELISINPEYDNVTGNEFSDYRCYGKVIGKAELVE